ncbi:hypothetical protein D3C73_919870 [compost metagenome]
MRPDAQLTHIDGNIRRRPAEMPGISVTCRGVAVLIGDHIHEQLAYCQHIILLIFKLYGLVKIKHPYSP